MNILFITLNGIKDAAFGGAKASIRNYNSLKKYGSVIPYEIKKRSNAKSAISCFQGNMPPILNEDINNIIQLISKEKIDLCFMDSSWLGSVIKNVNVPCITFFHNCESDYNKYVRFGQVNNLKKLIYQKIVDRNEAASIKLSKKICVFTSRDSDRLNELYARSADYIIPLSIVDKCDTDTIKKNNSIGRKTVLLFGPTGAANDEAFTWFAKNVSPYLTGDTLIAGKGIDHLKNLESDQVHIHGDVESIQNLYNSVDCVAIPLLSGGGMKIKTAEALMFGKYIFGTDEAFVGYDNNLNKNVAYKCNTAQDFINSINDYFHRESDKFIPEGREIYLNYYSPEATQGKFDELIDSLHISG